VSLPIAGTGTLIIRADHPFFFSEPRTLNPEPSRGGWTIPILCAGIALIACCFLIPQADSNRRLIYEREKLRLDLKQIDDQIARNDDFLHKLGQDSTLAQRLAQRQMKIVPQGTAILDLHGDTAIQSTSPFLLVSLPSPPQLIAYKPVGGRFADLCRNPHSQLYLAGLGMLLVAAGLVLGSPAKS
jgi:hypothetical protein